jgi:hypothetical protein
MVQIDRSVITQDRTPLPHDWQEIRLIRTMPDGGVVRYLTPDAFFNPEFKDPPKTPYPYKDRRYTILGNYAIFGGVSPVAFGDDVPVFTTQLEVELTYYQSIPPLTETDNNWANCMHPLIYTLKILHIASMYSIEDDRSPVWDAEVVRFVNGMNLQHKIDMASGSVLTQVRRKSFG